MEGALTHTHTFITFAQSCIFNTLCGEEVQNGYAFVCNSFYTMDVIRHLCSDLYTVRRKQERRRGGEEERRRGGEEEGRVAHFTRTGECSQEVRAVVALFIDSYRPVPVIDSYRHVWF